MTRDEQWEYKARSYVESLKPSHVYFSKMVAALLRIIDQLRSSK